MPRMPERPVAFVAGPSAGSWPGSFCEAGATKPTLRVPIRYGCGWAGMCVRQAKLVRSAAVTVRPR
jgi:hypothetical protein